MYWMLLHAGDESGIWLYRQLRQRGLAIELVTIDEWFCNRRFSLTIDEITATSLQLQDGRWWESTQTRAVLARVCAMPDVAWQLFANTEKDYVAQEWQAIFVAWIELMPMLFNRPTPMGLSGRNRSLGEWLQLANTAGFDTKSLFYDSQAELGPQDDSGYLVEAELLVYRGRCYGHAATLPLGVQEMACRLQAQSGEAILGITLGLTATGVVFVGATTHPDLRLGEADFVQAVLTDLHDDTALRDSERFAPSIAC